MQHLKLFHRDALTVRSHQWKYYVEPFTGCPFQCTYCLYWESDAFLQRLRPPDDLIREVEQDLQAMTRRQIVYIGATIDPYQRLEKQTRSTRQILERLSARDLPVVILTKSPLILRDLDLLVDMSRRGLVLVQFTVLTTNEGKARAIERAAPGVRERLLAAATLADAGVPVHFHLSPVIPGLYEGDELDETVREIGEHGGQCIYSNILGMRYLNKGAWTESVARLPPAVAARIRTAYDRLGDPEKNVYSPDVDLIYEEMSLLRGVCARHDVDFICEFIPGLDLFDPARFTEGIFRFGLPAVYQMALLFDGDSTPKNWPTFRQELRRRFTAVDDEYLKLVGDLWADGTLFDNSMVAGRRQGAEHVYFRTGHLQLAREAVLAWD